MNVNYDQNDLDPRLTQRFSNLRQISPRDPQRAALGRAAFLSQARELAQKQPYPLPVSPSPRNRLFLWLQSIPMVIKQKEKQPVFTKIMAVFIAAVLVFGGAAVTAYASQASLPNDALYGVKTFGENLRLSLAPQTNAKLGVALDIAQRRVEEMAALSQLDMDIPMHLAQQYQEQVEYTLRLAASLPDDQIVPALERVRTQLREQLRLMEQLHQARPEDPALVQAREQLRQQLRLVDEGIVDPLQFRARIRHRQQFGFGPAPTEPPGPMVTPPVPGSQNGNGNANNNGNENANGNGNRVINGNGNRNGNGNDDNPNAGDHGDSQDDDNDGNNDSGKDDDGGGKNDNGGGKDDNGNDDDGDDGDDDEGGGSGSGGSDSD